MKALSLKEFLSKLNMRLNELTHDELKEILLEQATRVPPGQRQNFLDNLVLSGHEKSNRPVREEGDRLLEDIDALVEELSSGEEEAWGWDDEFAEETSWRDQSWELNETSRRYRSWEPQLDELFDKVRGFYEGGNYALARKAYQKLLEACLGIIEEGELPESDLHDGIQTDLNEATLRYLRCVYLTEKPASRPPALWEGFSEFYDYLPNLSLEGIMNVAVEELPELQAFAEQWIPYVKKQGRRGNRLAVELLKEAVRLFQGVKGLEILATKHGRQFPGIFVEWLKVLKEGGDLDEVMRVALMGLQTVAENLAIRATIADYLYDAASTLDRNDLAEGLTRTEAARISSNSDSALTGTMHFAKN